MIKKKDAEKVLQINTEAKETLQVSIDGNSFDMVEPGELELKVYMRIANTGRKISKLLLQEETSAEDEKKCKALVEAVVKEIAPNIPEEIYNKLTDIQKLAIMNFFSRAAREREGILQQMPI